MKDSFAIDPSIRACGWARFIHPTNYIYAGLCRSKEKRSEDAILDITNQIKSELPIHLSHLIIERPILLEGWTKNRKALEKLLACYGALLTLKEDPTVNLWTPSVPEWKGQISKNISYFRALRIIRNNYIQLNIAKDIPNNLLHNTQDAIALLTTYLVRERIIHV